MPPGRPAIWPTKSLVTPIKTQGENAGVKRKAKSLELAARLKAEAWSLGQELELRAKSHSQS